MRKTTIEEFIEKARKIHGNKYDYSKVEYIDANTKVCIICPIHGEFWMTPANHLYGQGCKLCNNIKRYKLRRKTLEQFIKEAKTIHGDKYDYSKVNYINTDTKVCIICPEHGEFWQTPYHHLHSKGCNICSGKTQKTTKQFIEEARKVHGDKYDYSKVEYVNASTKVCIICPIHGEFWQNPANHLQGQGCPACGNVKHKTTEDFIKEARKVHGDKYDYSKVEYKNANTKVCIICPIHGEFWQTPHMHLQGKGCKKCSIENIVAKTTQKASCLFEGKAKKIHGDKYDYSKVNYINAHTKVCIICPIHGEFWQTPNDHLSGGGCLKCSESMIEKTIRLFLEYNNIKYIKEKRFNWMKLYRLDFYLPEYNVAIECQGIQHFIKMDSYYKEFNFEEQIKRDEEKYKLCQENDINIFYFTRKEHFKYKKISSIYKNNLYYNIDKMFNKILKLCS